MYITTIFIILGILVLVGGFIGYRFIGSNDEVPYEFAIAQKGNVRQIISVDGSVVADSEIELKFQTSGRIARINYEVGQEVKKGSILATLESRDQGIKIKQQQASLAQAQANLDLKLAGASAEDIHVYETAVANAKISVASAHQSLEDAKNNLENVKNKANVDLANLYDDIKDILNDAYTKADAAVNKQTDDMFNNDQSSSPDLTFIAVNSQAGSDAEWQRFIVGDELEKFKMEIDNLGSECIDLDEALIKAKNHLTIIQDFLIRLSEAVNDAVGVSQATINTYKTDINTGRTNINTALFNINTQKQLIVAQKITNKKNIDSAQQNINTAEANLKTAQGSLKTAKAQLDLKQIKPRAVDIANLKAKVLEAEASLELAQEELRKTKLTAPCDGIITKINGEIGENINTTNIFIIMNTSQIQIEANVPEVDVAKVKMDNLVEITLDAFGDRIFFGKIVSLEPAETNIQGVIYYQIKVVFDEDTIDANIMPGMTANLDILTAQKDDVLVLPIGAVKQKDSKKYVQIFKNGKNGKLVDLEIEIGLEGVENVEIIKGLKQGDKVVSFIK